MSSDGSKAVPDSPDAIATVRMQLHRTAPPIWREIEVSTAVTLEGLHEAIQAAMGWLNYHLWEFRHSGLRYGPPANEWDDGDPGQIDGTTVRLGDLVGPEQTEIDYLYDYGDEWDLLVIVSSVRAGVPGLIYPRYVSGERNAPPEDCGGVQGFDDLLEALAKPRSRRHKELREWAGDYDPHNFDEARIRKAMTGLATRHRALARQAAAGTNPRH